MQGLITYIIKYKKGVLLMFFCLCLLISVNAQHKKATHKSSKKSSVGHKSKTTAHHSSGSSHSKKSRHTSSHSKSARHGKGKHGHHHYEAFNDQPSEDTYVPIAPITDHSELRETFVHPPDATKPWVYWYWQQSAISREGITLDLQAMKDANIGGAYLVTVNSNNTPSTEQSNLWWQMIGFAMSEADRMGLKLAINSFANATSAGNAFLTPDLAMQKLTWSKTIIHGGHLFNDTIAKPQTNQNYYRDVAVFAYPIKSGEDISTETVNPVVSTNRGDNAQFLSLKGNRKIYTADSSTWVQYAFDNPFACRSVSIHTNGMPHIKIQISYDGQRFMPYMALDPAEGGTQNSDGVITYAIQPVTSKYFRFVFDKPVKESPDAASGKFKTEITGIALYAAAQLNQYELKNKIAGIIPARTTKAQIPNATCVQMDELTDITSHIDARGKLNWNAPYGDWVIIRMGNTLAENGNNADQFNPEAVKLQFNNWYAEAARLAGPDVAARVLKLFYTDANGNGQNWSPVFQQEFIKRRGYDLTPYLPAMAGVPLESVDLSEKFLRDIRQTITEVLNDNFYSTLATLAHQKGAAIAAQSIAADMPAGEFGMDKPANNAYDAVSFGHIYGKQIIQAKAFTETNIKWDEYPGLFKPLADRNLALGVNSFVVDGFNHNPYTDHKPGLTLDGVGPYFQRDQTWFKPSKALFEYLQRCQTLLQMGKPVTDIAVFSGEDIVAPAVLPNQLISTMPGLFGNIATNMADAGNCVNPLRGYAYDSFNSDALLRLATVKDGRIELPDGASYGILVLPGATKASPNGDILSRETLAKVQQLVNDGATILVNGTKLSTSLQGSSRGRIIKAPYTDDSFNNLGLERDMIATDTLQQYAKDIAWNHRITDGTDIYFIANQQNEQRIINLSLRVANKIPEMWDPLTGETYQASGWTNENGRTSLTISLEPNGSFFIILRNPAHGSRKGQNWSEFKTVRSVDGVWEVRFDPAYGGPDEPVVFTRLTDWSKSDIPSIKYYSGTADYLQIVKWNSNLVAHRQLWLDLGSFANIASVTINGIFCGTAWSPPYRVDITKAMHTGYNKVHVEVSNTWQNRLIRDHTLPENKRITNTTAPYLLNGKPLLPAGLFGPVTIVEIDRNK